MKKTSIRSGRTLSIRTRVLTIALVPCIVFLLAGAGGASYLIYGAAKARDYFTMASEAQRASLPLIVSLQEERRLTLRRLASFGTFQSELIKQRGTTDAVAAESNASLAELNEIVPPAVQQDIAESGLLMAGLPELRARVDEGKVSIAESFAYYNKILDKFIEASQGLTLHGPVTDQSGLLQLASGPLLIAADHMQRADALASANMVGGGLTAADFRIYQGLISSYHAQLDNTIKLTEPEVRQTYAQLRESPAWLRLVSVEDVLLRGENVLPISEDLWRGAARDVGDALMDLVATQTRSTIAAALDDVDTALWQAIGAGALVLALAVGLFVVALRLSRRLIARLTRLRTETLELAEKKLPELVERVRTGSDVSLADVRLVDHGHDEIGEVADAFNKAQQTAVTAAVQEAKTREGTKTVFLNIAHRSQVIVHRQLKVLDEAERRQEDPDQLEMLFQLDHLSTRARRNAENLIILGGGQPGRRWRKPVSLTELARGAAAETEDFARVKIAKLPPLAVNGPVVGDLVHLLAELIDNATSFSPPQARVEVRGNVVGRGVVLEVEDQGLGIEAERIEGLNEMLRRPPDFGIMALSTEPRLGLFVVARLAARHGISVTLRESAYGGTRAVVLVRAELLVEAPAPDQTATPGAAAALVTANGSPAAGAMAGLDANPSTSAATTANGSPTASTAARPAPVDAEVDPEDVPVEVPTTVLPVPVSFLQPLPAFPVVAAKPGEDLFRPQRPVDETAEPPAPTPPPRPRPSAPAPPVSSSVSAAGGSSGRPPLPQRRRQQNLAPQLRDEPVAAWPEQDAPEDTPDAARNRLSAFVRGTRRGREEPAFGDVNGNGENSVGSVRNGQHRAE